MPYSNVDSIYDSAIVFVDFNQYPAIDGAEWRLKYFILYRHIIYINT